MFAVFRQLSPYVKMLCLALGLSAVFFPVSLRAEVSHLSQILSEKKLTVGYITYNDLTSRNLDNDKIVGFFPDLIEAIAKEAGIPQENITYVATDWANFAVGLETGKYDLSIAGTFTTIPRATAAAFTRPIFYFGNSAIVLKDDQRFNDVTDVMQLDRPDLTIAVVSGEQSHDFVRARFKHAKIQIIKSADLTTALMEVIAKRADVALSDHYIVKSFVAKNPNVKDLFADSPWNIQPIAWAVRSDDQELLNFLNASLDYFESTGRLREMMLKPQYANIPFLLPENKIRPIH